MKRLLCSLLACSLALCCSGCSGVFVGGAINPGFSTVSGTVSFIQLSNVMDGSGGFVVVTFVTFQQSGAPSTVGFCGDQTSQFPMNQMVKTNFNPGQPCAGLIVVILIG